MLKSDTLFVVVFSAVSVVCICSVFGLLGVIVSVVWFVVLEFVVVFVV